MAKLPTYDLKEAPKMEGPGVRIPPYAFTEPAEALGKVGSELSRIGREYQERIDAQRDQDFLNELMVNTSRSWTDFETNQRQAVGPGAQGYTQSVRSWWDKTRQNILGKAPSDRAKQHAETFLTRMQIDSLRTSALWEHHEHQRYSLAKHDELHQEFSRRAYRNPDLVSSLAEMETESLERAAETGGFLNRDQARELQTKNLPALYEAAFSGLLEQNPGRALEEIKSGKWDAHFTVDQLERLTAKAEAATKRGSDLSRALTRSLMESNLASVRTTGVPIAGATEQVAAAYPDLLDQYRAEVGRAQTYYTTTQEIAFLPENQAHRRSALFPPFQGRRRRPRRANQPDPPGGDLSRDRQGRSGA